MKVVMSVVPGRERARLGGEGRFPHGPEHERHQVGESAALAGHWGKTAVVLVGVVETGGGDACVGSFGRGERFACVAHSAPYSLVPKSLLRPCRTVHL